MINVPLYELKTDNNKLKNNFNLYVFVYRYHCVNNLWIRIYIMDVTICDLHKI